MNELWSNLLTASGLVLAGGIMGYGIRWIETSIRHRAVKRMEAPVPVKIGYGVNNQINGKWQHGDVVTIAGHDWTIM